MSFSWWWIPLIVFLGPAALAVVLGAIVTPFYAVGLGIRLLVRGQKKR